MGRKKKFSGPALVPAIERANLLYHQNALSLSAVARNLGASPGTVEPLIFGSKAEWERWEHRGKPAVLPKDFTKNQEFDVRYTCMLPIGEVTPKQVEDDPRFERFFDCGWGHSSSSSDLGSQAFAALINWWRNCLQGGSTLPEMVAADVNDLKTMLDAFRDAVLKDPTLVTENAPGATPATPREWVVVYQDMPFSFTSPSSLVVKGTSRADAVKVAVSVLIRNGLTPALASSRSEKVMTEGEWDQVFAVYPHLKGNFTGKTAIMSVDPFG